MSQIKIQRGDIFCVGTGRGWLIRWWTSLWSYDGKAEHNHSGIILDEYGKTFEAMPIGLKEGNISKYKFNSILILRPKGVTKQGIDNAIKIVENNHLGKMYPYWRLLLHIIPPFARFISTKRWYVCSEIVAEFLRLIGKWRRIVAGTTPDNIADYGIENTDDFDVVLNRRLL